MVALGAPALADEDPSGWGAAQEASGQASGQKNGKRYSASAGQVSLKGDAQGQGGSASGGGNLSVPAANWEPPPCWYAPKYSPKQLKKEVDASPYELTGRRPDNGRKKEDVDGSIRDKYTKGDYKNFNLKKQGDGMFWAAVPNPNEPDKAQAQSCTELPFWVKNGEQPDVPGAINTKILAALAYQAINVPDTKVELNPKNKQTVRLPTWTWLDKATFKPVSVTASVDLGGGKELSATTTVKPGALNLDPGTDDANLHPASGKCPADKNGTIGTPYTKGNAKKTPPCGLTYLRSTPKGETYTLQASVVWEAAWKGSDGTSDTLPDGTFGNEQPVTVQEVQSINR
ncbi:hypothetical protein [Streptomyces sp. NPDC048172]|uniref:hypothetical protein n=1 Tax=Streptomyces sp. NPDC048172 TaxID=3365505 RepID=UPI00371BE19C